MTSNDREYVLVSWTVDVARSLAEHLALDLTDEQLHAFLAEVRSSDDVTETLNHCCPN
jgi:hypothetical protein